jgi:hypothetical protein
MWLEEAFNQGARINNLMGGLSFLAGLALWLSSLELPKRANYDLFYKLHHIGFWGFFLGGVMHYSAMIWYFVPGLALYAVDAAYRLQQGVFDRSASVVGAASDGCQEVRAGKCVCGRGMRGGGYLKRCGQCWCMCSLQE